MSAPTIARLNVEIKLIDVDFQRYACPRCGADSPRHDGAVRHAYDAHLDHVVVLQIRVGVYRCPNCRGKGRHFRTPLDFLGPRLRFVDRCRQKLVEAVELDQMPIGKAVTRLKRDFNVTIAPSTGWEWHRAAAPTDAVVAEYELLVAESFSGVLAVDEVYDGGYGILVACDPLTKRTVAYELCEGVTQAKVIAFFERLKGLGIEPEVINTDGSALYPKAIKAVWANCQHQLCRFHWTSDVTKEVVAGVRLYRETLPKPAKQANPGRPTQEEQPARKQAGAERAARDEVRKGRLLFVTREENLDETQQQRLAALLANHPNLAIMRAFMVAFYGLFAGKPTPTEANGRRETIVANPAFVASPYLVGAMKIMSDEAKFAKVSVYLSYTNLDSTSNAPERDNRGYRKRQMTHYRLRDKRSIEIMLRRRLLRHGAPTIAARLTRRFEQPELNDPMTGAQGS